MRKFQNKPIGILNSSDLKTTKGKAVYWVTFLCLVAACIIALLPTLWVLLSAFKDTQEIFGGFSFFPKDMSPGKFVSRIQDSWIQLELGPSMLATFLMSLGSLAFTVAICGFGGYALSRLKPLGTRVILALILWTMMMPSQMRLVPLYISWLHFPFAGNYFGGGLNLINSYWPIWLSAAANAFNMLLFKNSFDAVPISYVEAARLDGCSSLKIFFRIMVPLSTPVLIYVAIMTLSAVWSEFFIPYLVLQSKELQVMPVRIYLLKNDRTVQMNTYMMGLIFASMPPFVIFLFFQKYILGGINIGGIKG